MFDLKEINKSIKLLQAIKSIMESYNENPDSAELIRAEIVLDGMYVMIYEGKNCLNAEQILENLYNEDFNKLLEEIGEILSIEDWWYDCGDEVKIANALFLEGKINKEDFINIAYNNIR